MSQPKLAALSYMVEDGQCEGIPAQLKPVYQKEASECKKVEVVPAKVLDLFQHMQHQNQVSHSVHHVPRVHVDTKTSTHTTHHVINHPPVIGAFAGAALPAGLVAGAVAPAVAPAAVVAEA